MEEVRIAFLNCFPSHLRGCVLEFGKRLTDICSQDNSLLIFQARKAVCFAESLRQLRFARLNGMICSDRVLDMNCDWMRGKNITLVDDAIISGTSLAELRKNLINVGIAPDNISTIALCVNKTWWVRDLIDPVPPYLALGDDETGSFCANIVEALSIVPYPYSVDFPLYHRMRIRARDIETLHSLKGWVTSNTTSSLQRSHNVFSTTFVPGPLVSAQLDKLLGWPFSQHSLLKLRLYARYSQRTDSYWCSLVPMCAMHPLNASVALALFNAIEAASGGHWRDAFTPRHLPTPEARDEAQLCSMSRLISFVAASTLASAWHNDLQSCVPSTISLQQDKRFLSYLFSPQVLNLLQLITDSDYPLFLSSSAPSMTIPRPSTLTQHTSVDSPIPSFLHKDGLLYHIAHTRQTHSTSGVTRSPFPLFTYDSQELLDQLLLEPFRTMYRDQELPARRLAQMHKQSVLNDPTSKPALSRLKRGLSLDDLYAIVSILDVPRPEDVLSSFLDRAIDKGCVVPITFVRDGKVCRAYRHGEDVEFGAEVMKLAATCLAGYVKTCHRDPLQQVLSNTTLEKLLVLFIKAGVNQSFLDEVPSKPGERNNFGVRYSMFGALVARDAPKIYLQKEVELSFGEERDPSDRSEHIRLSRLLLGEQHIEGIPQARSTKGPNKNFSYYRVNEPQDGMDEKKRRKARLVGIILAEAHLAEPRLTQNELVLLASCLTPLDAVGALAAEIDIAQRNLSVDIKKHIIGKDEIGRLQHDLIRKKIADFVKSPYYTAAHNGLWKLRSIYERKAWEIIDRINASFTDDLKKETWMQLWPARTSFDESWQADFTQNLLGLLGSWLLDVGEILDTVLTCFNSAISSQSTFSISPAAVLDRINSFRSKHLPSKMTHVARGYPVSDFLAQQRDASIPLHVLLDKSMRHLDERLFYAKHLLHLVDEFVANHGKPDRWEEHAYVLVVESEEKRIIEECYHSIQSRARKHPNRTYVDAVSQLTPDCQQRVNDNKYCIYTSRGSYARVWLIRLACDILARHLSSDRVNCILFADFPVPSSSLISVERGGAREYSGTAFFAWLPRIMEVCNRIDSSHFGLVRSSPRYVQDATLDSDVLRESTTKGRGTFTLSRCSTNPIVLPFDEAEDASKAEVTLFFQKGTGLMADVGIITVVPDELKGIKPHLEAHRGFRQIQKNQTYYYEATLPSATKGSPHLVVCRRQTQMGQFSTAAAYRDIVADYNPKFLVLLGIGGALHSSVNLCDVVIATDIVYYEPKAITEDGTKRRPVVYRTPANILKVAQLLFHEGDCPKIETNHIDAPQGEFRLHSGLIASGESVVKSKESDIRIYLSDMHDKILAVDMEAAAFAHQFFERREKGRNRDNTQGFLVIRGISDHANHEKDDRRRVCAASHAMVVLKQLLSVLPKGLGL